jgi:hypothetical protein
MARPKTLSLLVPAVTPSSGPAIRLGPAPKIGQSPPFALQTGNERRVQVQRPSLREAFARLDELADIGPDWDSYGADPPTDLALGVARSFFLIVANRFAERWGEKALPSHIAPIPTGGILAEWSGPKADLEIHIGPDGQLGHLVIDRRGSEPVYREASLTPALTAFELIQDTIAS